MKHALITTYTTGYLTFKLNDLEVSCRKMYLHSFIDIQYGFAWWIKDSLLNMDTL